MSNFGKKAEIFIIIVVIALIGVVYALTRKPVLAPTISQTQNQDDPYATNLNLIEYKGQDRKNALDLLKASHMVEAKHYSFGDMVIGIDGVSPDANHFWAMYINGEFSQVGASQYMTKNSDSI